ncbi:MAG: hypothetical protein JW822_14710 [Spirochaetales bacterium]|nr:hypothetical protein [Spirochaetales bacterium]
MPFENTDIRLVNERIDVYLYRGYYEVKVEYEFFNEGDTRTLTIGFPVREAHPAAENIENFLAFENKDNALAIEKIESNIKDYSHFYCFNAIFHKLQKKIIRNQYSAHYSYESSISPYAPYDMPAGYRGVSYILETGAFWKDTIKQVEVYFHFMYFTTDDLQDKYDGRVYKALYLQPSGYEFVDEHTMHLRFRDIEPDFNIELFFSTSQPYVSATSELREGDCIYKAGNVIDNEPATAWIEGVSGSGIDERIIFAIGPIYSKEPGSYLVKKIGIINGFCMNSSLFYKNNRVKKVRLIWYSHYEERPERAGDKANHHEKIIELNDTMQMQFIEFEEPVRIYEFSLEILDVYKGSVYDDTCLSEVKVFYHIPAQ